jgi:hypothetical protein
VSTKRSRQEQAEHDLAVRRICRARFNGNPQWDAFTNPGTTERFALLLPDGRRLYPDIVARRKGDAVSSYVAEVETASTVNEQEAGQWQLFAGLGKRFLLYVPAGSLLRARELCQQRRIAVHGYRVYELTPFWVRIRDFPV